MATDPLCEPLIESVRLLSIVNVFDLTQICFVWNPKIDSLTYKSIEYKNLKNNYLNLLALDFSEKQRFLMYRIK
jgi:hypothetical protein